MKRIVVTGATSMVGVALLEAALQDGSLSAAYAVVRPGSQKLSRLPKDGRIRVVPCDVEEYDTLAGKIPEQCDVFFHLAWPRTETYRESCQDILRKSRCIQTALAAVMAAKELGCGKFVGAGSQSEYGIENSGKMSPETYCRPVRADGVLHLAAGQLAHIVSKNLGMSSIWMRIFSVYGRYDRDNSMISTTIRKLRAGQHCSFTPCEQMWDYLAAEDLGRAFYLAGERASGQRTYCVGCGQARPLREYIETLRDVVAPGAELGFGELPYPQDAVMYLCADTTALRRDTGWTPQIGFRDGIRRIYEFQNDRPDADEGRKAAQKGRDT